MPGAGTLVSWGRDAWFAFRSRADHDDLDPYARAIFETHTKAMAELGVDYDASMLLKHEVKQRNSTPKLPCRAAAHSVSST